MKVFVILAFFSLLFVLPVSSEQIPDLTGAWDQVFLEQFSDETSYGNLTGSEGSYVITSQEGRAFTGYTAMRDQRKVF